MLERHQSEREATQQTCWATHAARRFVPVDVELDHMRSDLDRFWKSLLSWFVYNRRDYPWRNTRDGYHVLIAESLLQQTNVEKVEPVYNTLVATYPTPGDLAHASSTVLCDAVRPLGLVGRAHRLQAAASEIDYVFGGITPDSERELLNLPGVGAYTSDAILCYAYDKPTIPIDDNVLRVFKRRFGIVSSKKRPRTDKTVLAQIRSMYPEAQLRDANLAILDFAALICRARKPRCDACPVSSNCHGKG